MTNRASKRFLAILMTLAMLLSLVPAVFAAEDEDDPFSPGVYEEITVRFPTSYYEMGVGESLYINDVDVECNSDAILSYQWGSSTPNVIQVRGDGRNATLSAKGEGTAYVTLTVRSPSGTMDTDTMTVKVEGGQSTPVTARAGGSTSLRLNSGDSQSVSVTASGGSGRYVYRWEDSDSALAVDTSGSGASNTVYGRYAGSGSVTVTVYDAQDSSNYAQVTWSGTVTDVSAPLTCHISQNEMTLSAGARSTLTLYAEGGSGNPNNYQYYWKSNNTGVVSVSGSGNTVTVTAASVISGGSGYAEISATVYDTVTKTSSETSSCGVVVKSGEASCNARGSAAVGTGMPMASIADTINSAYAGYFNTKLSYSASVRIFSPTSSVGAVTFGNTGGTISDYQSYEYAVLQDMVFQPYTAGTFVTNYSITDSGNVISGSITITVTGGSAITAATLSPSSLRMETYSSMFLTLNVTPANVGYTVSWSSSDTRIATVSGSGSVVTVNSQSKTGTANIVATIRDGAGATLTRTASVTVYSDSGGGGSSSVFYSPTLTVTMGSDYYDHGISDSLAKQWRSSFRVTLGDDARISFSNIGTTRYGMLHLNNGSQIRANTSYTFLDLRDMYFEPYAAGTFTAPYTLTYRGDEMTGNFKITVRATSLNVTMSPTSLSLTPYSTQAINLSVSPASAYYRVVWSTSNSNVATVTGTGTYATVTAKGGTGTATITATVTDGNGANTYRTCSVRVSGSASSSYDPTITIPLGINYTGTGTADAMASQFYNVYGTAVNTSNATIRFSSMGDSKIGILHMPNGSATKINTNYTLEQYKSAMYVETVSAGTYRLPYTLTYNGKTLSGTANFIIATTSVNCRLTLTDTNPYLFSNALSGSTGAAQLSNAITNAVGSSWTYVRFTSSSENTGTLYQNNGRATLGSGTNITSQAMSQLYFVPNGPGTFAVPFTVYSSNGKLADGTLSIVVPGSASSTFTDVSDNAYYANAVTWALQNEVTTGTTSTTFSPSAAVTRGQAVTFLWRAMGRPNVTNVVNPFKDVAADEYYTMAILWAVQQGITNGTSETTFSPQQTLVQDQMLTFLCRANGGAATGSDWSNQAMSWAQGRGLFNGRPSQPTAKETCPRADVVFYLWKNAGY